VKRVYVALLRAVRSLLGATGLLGLLDRAAARSRPALWVRSWLSIYDFDDMLRLDVPWWTFAAADEVTAFLRERPGARVLEWGSGASTVWLAQRAGSVVSIEHDPHWAARTARALAARDADNVELRVVEPTRLVPPGGIPSAKPGFAGLDFEAYADAVDGVPGELDLVVIDGRAREACLVRVLDRLADDGLIVFDNVDRARYRDAVEALGARLGARLSVDWTRGITPALPYPTRTALIRLSRVAS
jgi:precorrin-6B methylase 2